MIKAVAQEITQKTPIRVRTWESLNIPGRIIITQVLEAISEASIFICDLTYPNPNVLFELGFAIARKKRLWLTVDKTVEEKDGKLSYIKSVLNPDIGYSSY